MNVGLVPVDQILASDGSDGGILRLTGVRIVCAIRELGGFARRYLANLIIAPGDGIVRLFLGEVEFVGAEFRIAQQVGENFEDVVEVAFQATQANARGIGTAAGLDFGSAHFQKIVELISGLSFSAAGAPNFAEEIDEANFAGRLAT